MRDSQPAHSGFTLIELTLALALTALLVTLGVHIAQATTRAFIMQQAHTHLLAEGRFATEMIRHRAERAGYHPSPWKLEGPDFAVVDSKSGDHEPYDHLVLRSWSDRNCHDAANPVQDDAGRPQFFLQVSEFSVDDRQQLRLKCAYGPSKEALKVQINQFTLVANTAAFKTLFAEDLDDDKVPDRWVSAGQWENENAVNGVRVALLLTARGGGTGRSEAVELPGSVQVQVPDSHWHGLFDETFALHSRIRQ